MVCDELKLFGTAWLPQQDCPSSHLACFGSIRDEVSLVEEKDNSPRTLKGIHAPIERANVLSIAITRVTLLA